jgi:hypothetical protein
MSLEGGLALQAAIREDGEAVRKEVLARFARQFPWSSHRLIASVVHL